MYLYILFTTITNRAHNKVGIFRSRWELLYISLSGSVTLCRYIPSVRENPYEPDSKTVVLLMELNIHLRGFKMLKA